MKAKYELGTQFRRTNTVRKDVETIVDYIYFVNAKDECVDVKYIAVHDFLGQKSRSDVTEEVISKSELLGVTTDFEPYVYSGWVGREARFNVGTKFISRSNKTKAVETITDIIRELNHKGDFIKLRYVAEYESNGEVITNRGIVDTTIAMGLIQV